MAALEDFNDKAHHSPQDGLKPDVPAVVVGGAVTEAGLHAATGQNSSRMGCP